MRMMKVTSLSQLNTSKEYIAYVRLIADEQVDYIGLAKLYWRSGAWFANVSTLTNSYTLNLSEIGSVTLLQFCVELD